MAKIKNKKNLSENVNNKKENKTKKVLNPFEVHINKEKIRVLGKKLKNERGLPGISREKALKKRKRTLLPEYKLQHKNNQFLDKRIGEKNHGLSSDEKNMARYTAVRTKQHNKKTIFNLADDEVLTHKGQTLSEIERFDDPRSDDDDEIDEEPKSGKLESSFVEDAHFGGGILKKGDGFKSHKDLIDQLIAESKKRKAEKKKEKEATVELTEKLDSEWRDLLPIVNKSKREDGDGSKQKVDDYDKVMRELRFEARGKPSDKLKTEDDIAREEKEKLERLEQERLERMRGTHSSENKPKINHRSADDLDDNFIYEDQNDVTLTYDELGKSNIPLETEETPPTNNDTEESEDEGEEDEEIETDSEDNLSDLKQSEESETEEEEEEKNVRIKKIRIEDENEVKKIKKEVDVEKIKEDLLHRKKMMDEAREELPYTFNLPESYEVLQKILQEKTSYQQGVIIERMIKCNHPSLNAKNKESLGLLFVYMLQHLNDTSLGIQNEESLKECFEVFCQLVPHFYDLAQLNPENVHNCMLEVIKEKQGEYRKMPNKYPGLEVLLFLKLVSVLFSTSDFRHKVVIPCVVFMEQILTKCRITSRKDLAYGLFITSLILEFTTLSKRYLPAAVHYLSGILHMGIPKSTVQILKVIPPFKSKSSDLVITGKLISHTNPKLNIIDLITEKYDDEFRIRSLNVATALLKKFHTNFQSLPSCVEIFRIPLSYLNKLPTENYPNFLKNEIEELIGLLENCKDNRKLEFIVMEKKKPKALRLYEPNVVKIFDGKKFKVQSKEKAERDKLLHKIKKEKKGALREIRRDKAFLGRVKVNQKIKSDLERREKVKRIFSEAAMQQSELNAMDRKNSKKKQKY